VLSSVQPRTLADSLHPTRMKQFLFPIVAAVSAASLVQAQIGVNWTSTAGGTLGASTVTVTGFTTGAQILTYDLADPLYYSAAPLSTAEPCMDHHCNDDWTASFSPPVTGLTWYGKYTRGNGATGLPTVDYTFNHPFTILSGFASATVSGNTLTLPTSNPNFHFGILQFSGSISTLMCDTSATGGSYQAMTIGQFGPTSPGTSYCGPAPTNSTGSSGSIAAIGSGLVSANNLTVEATSLPNNSFGYFLTSQTQGLVMNPGGSIGNLCLGGSIGRYVGPGQIKNSGTTGAFSLLLDLGQMPTPGGLVPAAAGQTWNFQGWYRDSVGGTAVSNFTDGVTVPLQ
jgi:hypothetical protein